MKRTEDQHRSGEEHWEATENRRLRFYEHVLRLPADIPVWQTLEDHRSHTGDPEENHEANLAETNLQRSRRSRNRPGRGHYYGSK